MKAVVFGGNGLVGSQLVSLLLQDKSYTKVVSALREATAVQHDKLEQLKIDFDNLEEYKSIFHADVVFCCLGTTIHKAGSQKEFEKVDFEYVQKIAQLSAESNISKFCVISSIGAKADSKNFYLRTKGRMEEAVRSFPLPHIMIARPSLLLGKRNEFRLSERLGAAFMAIANPLLVGALKDFQSISASDVAAAMLQFSRNEFSETIYKTAELKRLAKDYYSQTNF